MKSNKKIIIIAFLTLVLGVLIGGLIFSGSSETKQEEDHQYTTEIAGEAVWTCSMHPQIRQHEPGDCPICGMALIPLESDQNEALDPMAISMSPTAMQLANVNTAVVGRMDPIKAVSLNGKVQLDERLVFSQASHIAGRIEKLLVNFTGEYISKGQTIAYLYSPDLVTAQEELIEAQKIKDTQPQLFKAAKEKLKNWKLTAAQVDQILQAGSPQEQFAIQSDVAGYVTAKKVNLGDYIRKGETLYEVANLSEVWVLFDVYESDISWIKKGDVVNFTVASLPGEVFKGKISFLDPFINPETRVAKARVAISNNKFTLKPEMFVSGTVEARLPERSSSIVIPKTAVMWTGKRSVVYVAEKGEQALHFKMREVLLGPSLGASYVIEEGLSAGEEIAVNGTFSIDAAAQLAGKPSMMSPEGTAKISDPQNGDTEKQTSLAKYDQAAYKTVNISSQAKAELQPLFSDYMEFKEALTEDDFSSAQKAAISLKAHLSQVDRSLFTGESHTIWMRHSKVLENELEHIAHQKNIVELRNTFQQVSTLMIVLAKSFKPLEKSLYVQHCPMAGSNNGADWLSTETEILNPYFGASMISCGELVEEINK